MPHRLRDGDRIAVTSVCIRHHRNIHSLGQLPTGLHVLEHGHHAQVFGHAKARIEQARATGRGCLVTHLFHQQDAVAVIHPGRHADLGVTNQGAHALCFAHHLKLLGQAMSLQQRLYGIEIRAAFFKTAAGELIEKAKGSLGVRLGSVPLTRARHAKARAIPTGRYGQSHASGPAGALVRL